MQSSESDRLLASAQERDLIALDVLMTRYRGRLRRMINIFLDPRISARVDASDVLQEALARAASRFPKYLEERPVAVYPWLRAIVRDEIVRVHRQHVVAQRRSVNREQPLGAMVSDDSVQLLVGRLVGRETSPTQIAVTNELKQQIRLALRELPEIDREILLMRCIEQLSIKEIMTAVGIGESAAKSRLSRAFQKISCLLEGQRS